MSYAPELIARVRELCARMTDVEAAKELSCSPWRIGNIRRSNGIPMYEKPSVWSPERLAELKRLYIEEGRPRYECAKLMGCTENAVKNIASKHGWVRDPAKSAENISKGLANSPSLKGMAAHYARKAKEAAGILPTRFIEGSDQDLIADFLARKTITVCEPGTAAGLSLYERQFFACPPPRGNYVEHHRRQAALGAAAVLARKAVSA